MTDHAETSGTIGPTDALSRAAARLERANASAVSKPQQRSGRDRNSFWLTRFRIARQTRRLARARLPLDRRRNQLVRVLSGTNRKAISQAKRRRRKLSRKLFRTAVAWFIRRYWKTMFYLTVIISLLVFAFLFRVEITNAFDSAVLAVQDFLEPAAEAEGADSPDGDSSQGDGADASDATGGTE